MKKIYTMGKLAEILKVSRPTVHRWVKLGMPHERTSIRGYAFEFKDVAKWMSNYDAATKSWLLKLVRDNESGLD